MCSSLTCLGFYLGAVLIGFTLLIWILLKYRQIFLKNNMQLTAQQIWKGVSKRATKNSFLDSNLLFGIWQDSSATRRSLVIKNVRNEIVGHVEFPMNERNFIITMGSEIFKAQFPLTWNQTAQLFSQKNDSLLATYCKLNIFGKHQFDVLNYGTLISERPSLSPRIVFNYRLGLQLIGTTEEISSCRQVGRLAVLPADLPLPIQIFILAL